MDLDAKTEQSDTDRLETVYRQQIHWLRHMMDIFDALYTKTDLDCYHTMWVLCDYQRNKLFEDYQAWHAQKS